MEGVAYDARPKPLTFVLDCSCRFLAFCAMTIAYCVEDGSHIIYGAVLWAAVLLAALQVWCRRFAAMNRSRWYVKNVLDVIVTSPASTSMASSFLPASPTHSHAARRGAAQAPRGAGAGPGAASVSTAKPSSGWQSQAWSGKHSDMPARSEDSHASPSSPTGTRRQPVVERLVSMLNRVRHDTANPNIAGDLAMAIEVCAGVSELRSPAAHPLRVCCGCRSCTKIQTRSPPVTPPATCKDCWTSTRPRQSG